MSKNGPKLLLGGGVAIALAAFLPWIKVAAPFVGTVTKAGVDNNGDGLITLGLGVAAIVCGWWLLGHSEVVVAAVALGAAVIVVVVGIVEVVDVNSRIESIGEAPLNASVGVGLWLTVAWGVVAAVGAIMYFAQQGAFDRFIDRFIPDDEDPDYNNPGYDTSISHKSSHQPPRD